MKRYTRIYLREWDVSKLAFEVYSNSSIYIYKDSNSCYYWSYTPTPTPTYLGECLDDVNEFLESFADDEGVQ